MSFTAGEVIATAAAFCNDPSQRVYTFAKMLVPLQQSMRDLQDELVNNDASFTKEETSGPIPIAALATLVTLPNDFWDIIELWERPQNGSNDSWHQIVPVEFLKDDTPNSEIIEWAYLRGQIRVNPPTTARDVKLFYYAGLTVITAANTVIPEDEYRNYLGLRTAAIAATIIGENYNRAQALDGQAFVALKKLLSLVVKGNQYFGARRRPYRSVTRERRNVNRRLWS